jgi:hypothetical protein
MNEVVYVDDKYSAGQMEWFRKNGVKLPVLNSLYTIRELVKPSAKEGMGVLLEEIRNVPVPVMHPILHQMVKVEPSFSISRFTTLSGEPLSREMVEEIKQGITVKQPQDADNNK